ncbi:MAG: hypothetical protein KGO92_07455 [Bacteroidota bacterium]|nr:hypothetical protein [Bacteroidota bacterium]
MYKSITILFIVCYCCYLLFSRQPDYFDGEKAPAVIHFIQDSASKNLIPMAQFSDGHHAFSVDARYVLRNWKEGERTEVIYETDKPNHAVVYLFWGYWIRWGEVLITLLVYAALFQIAISVTQNPTAESLLEQLEGPSQEKKRKYLE